MILLLYRHVAVLINSKTFANTTCARYTYIILMFRQKVSKGINTLKNMEIV